MTTPPSPYQLSSVDTYRLSKEARKSLREPSSSVVYTLDHSYQVKAATSKFSQAWSNLCVWLGIRAKLSLMEGTPLTFKVTYLGEELKQKLEVDTSSEFAKVTKQTPVILQHNSQANAAAVTTQQNQKPPEKEEVEAQTPPTTTTTGSTVIEKKDAAAAASVDQIALEERALLQKKLGELSDELVAIKLAGSSSHYIERTKEISRQITSIKSKLGITSAALSKIKNLFEDLKSIEAVMNPRESNYLFDLQKAKILCSKIAKEASFLEEGEIPELEKAVAELGTHNNANSPFYNIDNTCYLSCAARFMMIINAFGHNFPVPKNGSLSEMLMFYITMRSKDKESCSELGKNWDSAAVVKAAFVMIGKKPPIIETLIAPSPGEYSPKSWLEANNFFPKEERFFIQDFVQRPVDSKSKIDFTQKLDMLGMKFRAKAVILYSDKKHFTILVREGEDRWKYYEDADKESLPPDYTTQQKNAQLILWERIEK